LAFLFHPLLSLHRPLTFSLRPLMFLLHKLLGFRCPARCASSKPVGINWPSGVVQRSLGLSKPIL
jgi:hypothetical protein